MPLYEYYCEDCNKEFTLLQSASANQEETTCSECGSASVRRQMSTFTSKIPGKAVTDSLKKAGPVTADELPNKNILNLPIPRHVSEYHD